MKVEYGLEQDLPAAEFIELLRRSTLAERRPVGESETMERMLRNADVILTARSGGQLVGVSRAITDFAYCTYLSDLAVAREFQRRGIGRELIRRTHEAAGGEYHPYPAFGAGGGEILPACRHAAASFVLDDPPKAGGRLG